MLFLEVMGELSSEWSRPRQFYEAQAFKVVFQTEHAGELKARFAAAGYTAQVIANLA